MSIRSLLDLDKKDLKPLSSDGTNYLVHLFLLSTQDPETERPQLSVSTEDLPGATKGSRSAEPFALRVLRKRLEWAGGEYSAAAILFATGECTSPGVAVMWAYALWRMSLTGPVTLTRLVGHPDSPFAMGVPTQEAYYMLWDEQKRRGAPLGNALDDPTTWDREPTGRDFEETMVDDENPHITVESVDFEMPREESGWFGAFSRSQAEGAWPNGSRIVKTNGADDDGTPDGTEGTVLGSMYHPEHGYAYWIEYDDKPRCAVLTAVRGGKGDRLELRETMQ